MRFRSSNVQDVKQPIGTVGVPRSRAMTWVALLLAAVVFALDLLVLHGRGEAVLYVVVVLIFLWSTHWRYVLIVAAVCTVLTAIGFINNPDVISPDAESVNHLFSFVAVWLTAIIGMRMNHLSNKLGESELRARTIIESAAEGIITIDEHGTIESFNEAAERMFGYDRADVISQSVKLLMPTGYRDTHDQGRANYFDTGEQQIMGTTRELVGQRKDGTTFPLLIAVSEMWLGERRLFAGIALDMTDLRAAQSHAIQVERLAAIGEAMAGLAHESRNALQRSQAALEMLERSAGDRADARDLIGRIQAAQEDLHRLYEEVRGYAAPVTLRTQPEHVDLVMRDAWEKLVLLRSGRDAELTETGKEFDLTCELDAFSLRRVFRNILENSLAASQDPVRICVTYRETKLDGRAAIEVSIRDNGPGLCEQAKLKMFQPFFTTKTVGTGLGLAIAKRYVEAHGGLIEVPGNSGNGAEFRITLPRTQS